jgi:hypothetical protein
MIAIKDIPELVLDLERGDLSLDDLDMRLLDLLAVNECDSVMALLPTKLQERFASLLREFDEPANPDDIYIFSSSRGDHPDKHTIIAAARRWLRSVERIKE